MNITAKYDSLPKWVKVLVQIFLGYIISPVYRILKYLDTKNIVTLVVGIVCLVTGVGNFVLQIIDLVTLIVNDKISVLAD